MEESDREVLNGVVVREWVHEFCVGVETGIARFIGSSALLLLLPQVWKLDWRGDGRIATPSFCSG